MKYARLSLKDLKDLEKEFIEFLVINGIEAKEWDNLKQTDMAKVEKIIDQFSDVVWEGVLRKNKIVEQRTPNRITICRITDDKIQTLYVHAEDQKVDFTNEEDLRKVISNIQAYKHNFQEDKLEKEASKQIFEFLQVGFYLASNKAYDKLLDAVKK